MLFFSPKIHTMLAEIKMDDMILPLGSLFGTDQTVNPGHWAPPLLTSAEPPCLLQTHRHRSPWGKRDLTHFKGAIIDGWWNISNLCVVGVYSECLNQPLSSWAKVIRPDSPFRHTLQLSSRPLKTHGECWIKSKYLPVMQRVATVWENYQAEQRAALLMLVIQPYPHSSQAIHSVQHRS